MIDSRKIEFRIVEGTRDELVESRQVELDVSGA